LKDHRLGDHYEVGERLGQGGMGVVHAGMDLRTGQRVAIKWLMISGVGPGSPELLRFEQEARIAGALGSEHVVKVFDIGHDPGKNAPFLVMELLSGENLEALLDRIGALPAETAVRIAAQACAGLAAAHGAGVVHRDVKPANIFLVRRDDGEVVVKLLDFGIAKIRKDPEIAPGASLALTPPAMSMTDSGDLLGSPLFMSPEQVQGAKHVDARSDVYSLGVVLYAMLAGAAPYHEIKSLAQLLYMLMHQPRPSVRSVAPWVEQAAAAVVDKAMAHAPSDRFTDAAAMRDALGRLLPEGTSLEASMLTGVGEERRLVKTTSGVDPNAQTHLAPAAESSKRWMGWFLATIALVATIAGALALLNR
jgi:serine/threonine protein kinase